MESKYYVLGLFAIASVLFIVIVAVLSYSQVEGYGRQPDKLYLVNSKLYKGKNTGYQNRIKNELWSKYHNVTANYMNYPKYYQNVILQ